MSMQVNGVGNDYAARLYEMRLLQQTRRAQDTPIDAVQPVQRTETATNTARASRTSSVLTADQVNLSARAQQLLAQKSGGTSLTYGTALASADVLASGVPRTGQILPEKADLPSGVSAVSATRPTARNFGNPTRTSEKAAVNAVVGQSVTFEESLQNSAQKASSASQKVLSAGMQRYVQVQNSVIPQVQTTAVAMNLLA